MKKSVGDNNKFLLVLLLGAIFISVFVLALRVDYVNLISPANNTWTNNTNDTLAFTFNYTGNSTTASCELFINNTAYGINSSVLNNTNTIIYANHTISDSNWDTGLGFPYNWSINCTNASTVDGASSVLSTPLYFYVDTTNPLINYSNGTESNNSNVSQSNIYVNVSVIELNENVTVFRLYYSNGTLINISLNYPVERSEDSINWTNLSDGVYMYNVTAVDSAGNTNSTLTRTITLDTTNPLINYSTGTEANNSNVSQSNIYVNVSVIETNEANITFNLYNSSGSLNSSTTYTNGTRNITWTGLSDGVYMYNVTAVDSAGNTNSTLTRTITLDTTNPFVKIYSPTNTTYSTTSIDLNYTSSDTNLNTTWYNYNETNTTLTGNTTFTALEGISTLTLFTNDSAGNINSTNITFTVDTTAPVITLISPADGVSSTTTAYNFTFNVMDTNNVSNCSLIFNGHIIMDTITNVNNNGTNGIYHSSLGTGTRTWSVNCTDFVGNVGNSTTRTLTTNAVSSSSSSSTGSGYPTYWASQDELAIGYNRSLYKNWKIGFKIDNESYKLKLADITNSLAQINVGSNKGVSLSVGQEKMLDLNGDNYYDISVKLNSIDTTSKIYPKAIFTLKTVHQEITPKKEVSNNNNTRDNSQKVPQKNHIETKEESQDLTWVWVLVAVILILVLSGFGYKKFKK